MSTAGSFVKPSRPPQCPPCRTVCLPPPHCRRSAARLGGHGRPRGGDSPLAPLGGTSTCCPRGRAQCRPGRPPKPRHVGWCSHASRTERGSPAPTIEASIPSRVRPSTRSRTSTRCLGPRVAGTRGLGSRFFTKLDRLSLPSAPDAARRPVEDKLPGNIWAAWANAVPFGLNWQSASSLLMRVMNQALTVGLDFPGGPSTGRTAHSHRTPRQDLPLLQSSGRRPLRSLRCALHKAGRLLQLLCGGLRRALSAADGARLASQTARFV